MSFEGKTRLISAPLYPQVSSAYQYPTTNDLLSISRLFLLYLRGSLQYVELYWLSLMKIKMHVYWQLTYSKDLTISISI